MTTGVENLTMAQRWDYIYQALGIREYVYFVSSPELQRDLLPVKVVFILFTLFFAWAVYYFYRNSSYLKYKFLQDISEFVSFKPYGTIEISRNWEKIAKRLDSSDEKEQRLAVILADDFLYNTLDEMGYKGETFEELLADAKGKIRNAPEVLAAHQIRNSLMYEPDRKIELEEAKKMMSVYERAVKSL